jgi:hypothetical protein
MEQLRGVAAEEELRDANNMERRTLDFSHCPDSPVRAGVAHVARKGHSARMLAELAGTQR